MMRFCEGTSCYSCLRCSLEQQQDVIGTHVEKVPVAPADDKELAEAISRYFDLKN